jgi:manganese-dependent inorganic pyrophosphatase
MTTLVFGHKSPDTDSTGSPILWAWYLNEVKGDAAEAVLLGEPNTEAAFMLERWDLPKPRIIADVEEGQACVIVDTNNPAELPANVNGAMCRRSSTTTSWWAGWRRKARSTSPCARWPAPPRSWST